MRIATRLMLGIGITLLIVFAVLIMAFQAIIEDEKQALRTSFQTYAEEIARNH